MSDKYNGRYPSAWSKSDITFYEQLGREPAKTSNGLWASDVERERKPLTEWSLAELFALARGELFTKHVPGTEEFYTAVRSKAVLEDKTATRWGEEDLDNWLLFEKPPEKTPNGNYVNDPDRWVKDADTWNDSELVDLGMGFFGEPERHQLYILDEACARWNLPMGITYDDFCAYVQKGLYPEVTDEGVLINDRRRDGKPAKEWTDAELHAWVTGKIQSTRTDLLPAAIDHFGGLWFWGLDELRYWVVNGEIPDFAHDYSSYSDEQLERLVAELDDAGAQAELDNRRGVDEAEENNNEEVGESNLTEDEVSIEGESGENGYVPEEDIQCPGEGVEEDGELVEESVPDGPTADADDAEEDDPVVAEEPLEPIPEIRVVVVEEGSALDLALKAETPEDVINDTDRRKFLSASNWTAEELVGWLRGELPMGMNVTHDSLMNALRALCTSEVIRWSDRSLKEYLLTGKLPEGLSDGVLRFDRLRDQQHPSDWSDEELRAWCAGKVFSSQSESMILLSARIRFKVPDRLDDREAKAFIADGVLPPPIVPPIMRLTSMSKEQAVGYLKGTVKAPGFSEEEVLAVIRSLLCIDPHWTDAHIYNFHRNGIEPRLTTTGVMVEDRLRDPANPSGWKWEELKALALGEIEAEVSIESESFIARVRRLIGVQFGESCAAWSNEEVIEFLLSNLKPKALEDGVYINDPTRPLKTAVEWRDAEIKAWLRGKIEATEKATDEDLWEEVYVRFKITPLWYREDAKSYVLDGKVVPSTPSGIYIRDRGRDHRKAQHWTRREIKAWARGQILPGLYASEEVLANRAARLFNVSTLLDTESIKKRIADIKEESITMTIKFVSEDLKSYAAGREAAKDNASAAAPYQTLLDRCINRVLRLQGEDFVQGWTELLNFFHEHSKGIMSPKKIYIGVGQMAITPKGLRNFQNMTSILQATADPETRDRNVKLIDWPAALKEVSNEESRQSILAYYGL